MKKVLSNQLVLLGFALFIIFTILSMRQNSNKILNQDQNLQSIDQKNQTIRKEISDLESKITMATSDFSKEKRLRDELLLQKSGEYVVLLEGIEESDPEVISETVDEKSPWEKWRAVLW
ncbi:MAG: septum formation initiator family protein [bacterium]|nr:septum formation initiator family protein [bacterium]